MSEDANKYFPDGGIALSSDSPDKAPAKPKGIFGWYRGRAGQPRLPTAPWLWDREGQHGILAVLMTLMFAAFVRAFGPGPGVALYAVLVAVFVIYEIVEAKVLRDQAYRDLRGFKVGAFPSLAAYAVAYMNWDWLHYAGQPSA